MADGGGARDPPDSANHPPRPPLEALLKEIWDGESDPLVALREGRPGPFEAFVGAETRRFLAFFDRLGAPRAESEDLVQETFLKLFRLASTHPGADAPYRPEGRFLAFAFRVAKNAWIERRRREAARPRRAWEVGSGRPELEGSEEGALDRARVRTGAAPDASGPDAVAERLEEAARIRDVVGTLPDAHRLVFELGVLEERPYAEISEILEIPVGTVKSRMHNAVRKVRSALGGVDGDVDGGAGEARAGRSA